MTVPCIHMMIALGFCIYCLQHRVFKTHDPYVHNNIMQLPTQLGTQLSTLAVHVDVAHLPTYLDYFLSSGCSHASSHSLLGKPH